MRRVLAALTASFLVLITSGCLHERDVTANPGDRTDFRAGRLYRVKQPVFLFRTNKKDLTETIALAKLGFSATPSDLNEFRRAAPNDPQVVGLLMPGEYIRITKFINLKTPGFGVFLNVYATIASGEFRGTTVIVDLITQNGPSYNAFVNPEFLELVNE